MLIRRPSDLEAFDDAATHEPINYKSACFRLIGYYDESPLMNQRTSPKYNFTSRNKKRK